MKTCTYTGCAKKHQAKGYCATHYSRWYTHGDASFTKYHYQYKTSEYNAWLQARARCTNKKHPEYKNYGARGIKMHKSWNSYENFLGDMGRKPTPKHSIDRIDNNGNYEPSNCRWATADQQNHNRRAITKTGIKGISYVGYKNLLYRACVKRGANKWAKCFATVEEASEAYQRVSNWFYNDVKVNS